MAQAPETFAERLEWLRTKRHVSRRVLSELCGLNKNQVTRYERGEQMPNAIALIALADYFGVTVDYLLCRDK